MHQATPPSPSDINPALCPFKSILSTCPAQQAGQLTACTTGHQQATACQHWAELGRSADQAKNPAKSTQNRPCSKGCMVFTYIALVFITLYLWIYYLNTLYFKTYYRAIYYHIINCILIKMGFCLACIKIDPPLPKILDPFFSAAILAFFPVSKFNFWSIENEFL